MSLPPVRVAFLWHMHQPYYKDPQTGVYRLPWVRLHALKDYYDMAARLNDYPSIKANFNLVPCLVEQILDYAGGTAVDTHLELSRKPASSLTKREKIAFLRNSFLGNRSTIVERHPRYRALLEKCGPLGSESEAAAALKRLSDQDLLDLQVWSNLAWFDPGFKSDDVVGGMLARGRGFTEEMKADLIKREFEIIGGVVPLYRALEESGRVELTFSPYFHPIMPLLCDSESAREAVPGISLPTRPIRFAADAREQLEMGRKYHEQVFGSRPPGMWPPEGAMSQACLCIACEAGVRWLAADESMLAASLGITLRALPRNKVDHPELLYSPHRFECDGREAVLIFRDRLLSDLISFSYMRMRPEDAVADLMARLLAIRESLGSRVGTSLVLIAMDGENCWEFYDQDGDNFLRTLYSRLSESDAVETVKISDALRGLSGLPVIKRVSTGSWIGGNLATWIGSKQDNRAWGLLHDARDALEAARQEGGLSGDALAGGWRSVYAAEGSDWFWWWGRESGCREESEFDSLFRSHIMQIYASAGRQVPAAVLEPIGETCSPWQAISAEPAAFMKPVLDGRVTTFYEWKLAGLYEAYKDGFTHDREGVVVSIYYGFDQESLFLRLDTSISPQTEDFKELTFRLEFIAPRPLSVSFRAPGPRSPAARDLNIVAGDIREEAGAVALEIVEVAIPFAAISAPPGSGVSFRVAVSRGDKEIERRPARRAISLTVPGPDFEANMWSAL
jgi:alpha-amylase/alpha-mannosidase (GH57 family)